MRALIVQDERGCESDGSSSLLRQWSSRPEIGPWVVEFLRWSPSETLVDRDPKPDVLLVVEPFCPPTAWLEEVLALDVGLIAAIPAQRAEAYRAWAGQYPVQLLLWPSSVEAIDLAFANVFADLQRQRVWKARHEQLQQRLNDRILIERAKGVLVERMRITEREAYQRLRLQSRRQRRPIRDIAQNLLDAQSLFSPADQSPEDRPHLNGQAAMDRLASDP